MPIEVVANDQLHPSLLARHLIHLLQELKPSAPLTSRLAAPDAPVLSLPPRESGLGAPAALRSLRRAVVSVDQWLHQRTPDKEEDVSATAFSIDGAPAPDQAVRQVHVELCDDSHMLREGLAAIRQAARDDGNWIYVVANIGSAEGRDLSRLVAGAIPGAHADRIQVVETDFARPADLRDRLREAALRDGLTVIMVHDSDSPRFAPARIRIELAEIDRLGFQPVQRVTWQAEEACAIRPPARGLPDEALAPRLHSAFAMETPATRGAAALRFSLRPRLEQVEVVRVRPPLQAWKSKNPDRLPLPSPHHADRSSWRVHVAGYRGNGPGPVASALCLAGGSMGYFVRCIHNATPIGPDRAAWAQVLFTRLPQDGSQPALSAGIPYGEADVLLGMELDESLRAIDRESGLLVSSPEHSDFVINEGRFSDQPDSEETEALRAHLREVLPTGADRDPVHRDFSGACRFWFLSDRVTDLAILGMAFQRGFIPVTLDAMEYGVSRLEAMGYGRSLEVFRFGRQLAVDPRLFSRTRDDRVEGFTHLFRRQELALRRTRWRARERARRFKQTVENAMAHMPGLSETDRGRQARRDFLHSARRCVAWGGFPLLEQYAGHLSRLYQADRGDLGRALTCDAVLPLADAMLIHDPLYLATMAVSAEHRRRLRQRLTVKRARGDTVERRYLTRIELTAFGRSIRADVRSSDWPARTAALIRHLVPTNWRGSRRERELRDLVIDFVDRAASQMKDDYDVYANAMHRLHVQSAEDRLRTMAASELRMMLPAPTLEQE